MFLGGGGGGGFICYIYLVATKVVSHRIFVQKRRDRQTERQTDRQTDRQKDRDRDSH